MGPEQRAKLVEVLAEWKQEGWRWQGRAISLQSTGDAKSSQMADAICQAIWDLVAQVETMLEVR